jgi:hypothetical protein
MDRNLTIIPKPDTILVLTLKQEIEMVGDIIMVTLMGTILMALWVFMFFVFDELVLNGYFKSKLQKRLKVEE